MWSQSTAKAASSPGEPGLLMEERRKELEKDLEQAVRKARCGGLTDEEIRELFQLIMEE